MRIGGIDRSNIAVSGKRFKAWFMTPGVINYEDSPKGGQELLRKETIDAYLETLVGDALTIRHVNTKLPVPESAVNGIVEKVGYDVERGWHYCEGTVETDEARSCISDGWGLSVGMRALEFGPGGMWLNNPYDREIKRIKFHHLALVPPDQKPRIDEAEIRLNSTSKPKANMFRWIKKLVSGAAAGQEQVRDLPPETRLDLGGGATATLKDLVDHERNNAVHAVSGDDYVEHEGVRYHLGTLIKHFKDREGGRFASVEERVCALKTSAEAKTLADEFSERLNSAKALLEKATAEKADATLIASLQASHDEEVKNSAVATERLNSLTKEETDKAETARKEKEEADKKAELERQNAVKIEAEKKVAAEKEEAEKKAELERQNAAQRERAAGAESFAILAGASEKGARVTYVAPSSGMSNRLAAGRKLFGSDPVESGKN